MKKKIEKKDYIGWGVREVYERCKRIISQYYKKKIKISSKLSWRKFLHLILKKDVSIFFLGGSSFTCCFFNKILSNFVPAIIKVCVFSHSKDKCHFYKLCWRNFLQLILEENSVYNRKSKNIHKNLYLWVSTVV